MFFSSISLRGIMMSPSEKRLHLRNVVRCPTLLSLAIMSVRSQGMEKNPLSSVAPWVITAESFGARSMTLAYGTDSPLSERARPVYLYRPF